MAFRAAKESNNADAIKLTQTSPFNDPYMVAAIHFASQTNFDSANHKLLELVKAVWRNAILQTKINEDCNQKIQDEQLRSNMNKWAKHLRLWKAPCKAGLVKKYGRDELTVATNLPKLPRKEDYNFLFRSRGRNVDDKREGQLPLSLIRKDTLPFWSPNSKSMQKAFADMSLTTYLFNNGAPTWHFAEKAWHVMLVPVGEWIIYNRSMYYVVEVLPAGAILWPARKATHEPVIFWDPEPAALTWLHIYDVDTVQVVPTKAISPVHKRLVHGVTSSLSVEFRRLGKRDIPLLDWAADRGFNGVPESVVKRLFAQFEIGKAVPADPEAVSVEVMRHVKPDMTIDEALAALLAGRGGADIDCGMGDVDVDVLCDVCSPGEQKDIRDKVQEGAKSAARKRDRRSRVKAAVDSHFAAKPMTPTAKERSKMLKKSFPKAIPIRALPDNINPVVQHGYLQIQQLLNPELDKVKHANTHTIVHRIEYGGDSIDLHLAHSNQIFFPVLLMQLKLDLSYVIHSCLETARSSGALLSARATTSCRSGSRQARVLLRTIPTGGTLSCIGRSASRSRGLCAGMTRLASWCSSTLGSGTRKTLARSAYIYMHTYVHAYIYIYIYTGHLRVQANGRTNQLKLLQTRRRCDTDVLGKTTRTWHHALS